MQLLQPSWYIGLIMWGLIINYTCILYVMYRLAFVTKKTGFKNNTLMLIIFWLIPFTVFGYLYKLRSNR